MDERLENILELDKRFGMQTYGRMPVAFVRGRGCRLWDTAGKEYLDLISGIGVTVLGHCHPAVTEAIEHQSAELVHTSNLYYIEQQTQLAEILSRLTFPGRCFFANSGAEANEGAIKLARKHHFKKGNPRSDIVCLNGSFHGRTMTTLSATGQPSKWTPFEPVVSGFKHVELNDIGELEAAVDESTAAVLLEPIQGESGVLPATEEFLRAARTACDRTGALLLFDEVQTGLGRTGKMFAYQHSGVVPDVLTVAKGLANGVPIGAFIAGGDCAQALSPGDHASTFGGNYLACAAALATLETIEEEDLAANAREVGSTLRERLNRMVESVSLVSEVRGLGLMIAVQLENEMSRRVVQECMEKGLLVNNVTPSAVRLLPPLVLNDDEAEKGAGILEKVISGLGV